VLPSIGVTSSVQRVLLLGPDDESRRALHVLLDRRGLAVAAADDAATAKRHLAAEDCDVVLATTEIARELCAGDVDTNPPVIAILASRDVAASRALFDAGVADIVAEPVDDLAITLALRRIAARPRVVRSNGTNGANGHAIDAPPLIGDSAVMQRLRAMIATVAATRTTVLIHGETGTGKELVARAIHAASPRRARRFVAVNCAAIPAPLLESELFGHVRGAFTDAVRDKPGLFEDADGGTLFLDEVGELPLALQSKLLRALQDSEIRRVGDTTSIHVDVRLIAATLRDLAAEVAAGRFREDLYYRLNVVPVEVPPLRERSEDIAQLARYFAARHGERHGRAVALSDTVLETLTGQPWPGNVRDLENIIERAVVLSDGPDIDAAFLGSVMTVRQSASSADDQDLSIKKATRAIEQELIRRALGVTQGNRTNAAKLLEISHRALLYKMKEYGIS
jgi:two-component system response regulator AtoC